MFLISQYTVSVSNRDGQMVAKTTEGGTCPELCHWAGWLLWPPSCYSIQQEREACLQGCCLLFTNEGQSREALETGPRYGFCGPRPCSCWWIRAVRGDAVQRQSQSSEFHVSVPQSQSNRSSASHSSGQWIWPLQPLEEKQVRGTGQGHREECVWWKRPSSQQLLEKIISRIKAGEAVASREPVFCWTWHFRHLEDLRRRHKKKSGRGWSWRSPTMSLYYQNLLWARLSSPRPWFASYPENSVLPRLPLNVCSDAATEDAETAREACFGPWGIYLTCDGLHFVCERNENTTSPRK